MNQNVNQYSHLTVKERDSLSFPAKVVKERALLIGNVLDFGCGFGKDVELLAGQGFPIEGYDKHYFPKFPERKFDTIICFYVLNVLVPEEQALVLMDISSLLKSSGKAYFSVRRDLIYEEFRTHKIHPKPTFQTNLVLPFQSIFKNNSCEFYEYQHYKQTKHGLSECPFCHPYSSIELIFESAQAYSIRDRFPVNPGHSVIIPKRHVSDYFDPRFREQSSCVFMLNEVKKAIQKQFNPDGFNVGINIGVHAGQTVSHVHIHLSPRYAGDVEDCTVCKKLCRHQPHLAAYRQRFHAGHGQGKPFRQNGGSFDAKDSTPGTTASGSKGEK